MANEHPPLDSSQGDAEKYKIRKSMTLKIIESLMIFHQSTPSTTKPGANEQPAKRPVSPSRAVNFASALGVTMIISRATLGSIGTFLLAHPFLPRKLLTQSPRRCVTQYQIKDCKNLVGGDPTNLAGFKALIEEAQDHVRRAFDAEEVTDTEYKGMNSAMSDEERDYKLDHASTGRAGCQAPDCKSMEIKIGKGEVRFAYSEYYEGHCSWKYKHW